MSHHIRFQKAWVCLIPVLKGANGDLLLEQGACSCCREAIGASSSHLLEQAVGGGSAHGEQLLTANLREMQVSRALQRFEKGRQKRDQAFGTDPIGVIPDAHQSLLHLWSIMAWTWIWWNWRTVLGKDD